MHKTEITLINIVEIVQRERIKLRKKIEGQKVLVGRVEYSKEGEGGCRLKRGERPETLVGSCCTHHRFPCDDLGMMTGLVHSGMVR